MKHLSYFILILLISISCVKQEKVYTKDECQKRRDGLFYFTNTDELFTGNVSHNNTLLSYPNGYPLYTTTSWYLHIEDGKVEGDLYIFWDQDITPVEPYTSKMYEASFENGILNGKYIMYNTSGDKIIEGQMKNGNRFGTWQIYDRHGNLMTYEFTDNHNFTGKGSKGDMYGTM